MASHCHKERKSRTLTWGGAKRAHNSSRGHRQQVMPHLLLHALRQVVEELRVGRELLQEGGGHGAHAPEHGQGHVAQPRQACTGDQGPP